MGTTAPSASRLAHKSFDMRAYLMESSHEFTLAEYFKALERALGMTDEEKTLCVAQRLVCWKGRRDGALQDLMSGIERFRGTIPANTSFVEHDHAPMRRLLPSGMQTLALEHDPVDMIDWVVLALIAVSDAKRRAVARELLMQHGSNLATRVFPLPLGGGTFPLIRPVETLEELLTYNRIVETRTAIALLQSLTSEYYPTETALPLTMSIARDYFTRDLTQQEVEHFRLGQILEHLQAGNKDALLESIRNFSSGNTA